MATLDISTEYMLWDNVESVTVNIKSGTTYGSNITVANALRMDIDLRKQVFNGVRLESGQLFFWLPVAQVGSSNRPDQDMKITDSGGAVYYKITAVRRSLGNSYSHWECLVSEAAT